MILIQGLWKKPYKLFTSKALACFQNQINTAQTETYWKSVNMILTTLKNLILVDVVLSLLFSSNENYCFSKANISLISKELFP